MASGGKEGKTLGLQPMSALNANTIYEERGDIQRIDIGMYAKSRTPSYKL